MMHMEIPINKTEFYIHRDADFSGIPQTVKLEAPIKIIKGRTFLPALTLTESLGLTASWDKNTKTFAVKTNGSTPSGKVAWVTMDSTTVKSTIDQNSYIQMIAGRVLKVSLNDGRDITFTSYGSMTNVVAAIKMGDKSNTYHLIVPEIAEILLQNN